MKNYLSVPDLITITLEGDVYGLQIYHNHQWYNVNPDRNTLIVTIGTQMRVLDLNVSEGVLSSARRAGIDFFQLPSHKLRAYALQHPQNEARMLYTSSVANVLGLETGRFWRDALALGLAHPDQLGSWPTEPHNFKQDIVQFAHGAQSIEKNILALMEEGLGLDENYFEAKRLQEKSGIVVNHFPRCPQPTDTCGIPKHADPNLMTISIEGGAQGLQIWQGGEWKYVVPRTDTVLVTLGKMMQVVTNDIFRAPEHRVVVNSRSSRTCIGHFSIWKCRCHPRNS